MTVTKALLDLFRVDKMLRGLRSRLEAAERFLTQQQGLLSEMEKQKATFDTQLKQLRASLANDQGETARIDARMVNLREQMNQTRTAKEYTALLTELNNYKAEKSAIDDRVLEQMGRLEEIEKKIAEFSTQHAERVRIVTTAKSERDSRDSEIRDRVSELKGQRETAAKAIPASVLIEFETLIRQRGDEAMAQIEILDRRAHEGSCSACMMAVPVESLSALMGGKLTRCPSCRCVLYIEDGTLEAAAEKQTTTRKKKTPVAKVAKALKATGEEVVAKH